MTDTQNTPVEQATEAVSALRVVDGVTLPAAGTYLLDPMHTRIGRASCRERVLLGV